MSLLDVDRLSIEFGPRSNANLAVDELTFSLREGQTYGLVGESGSGKSVSMMALLGLLPRSARVTGDIRFMGQDLSSLSRSALRQRRGRDIGVVFQDPMTSLNPTMRIGRQIAEKVRLPEAEANRSAVARRAVDLLEEVGIADPGRRAREYPHQLSGGMRQRVMIAMAVASRPRLLIADEPTTALDVTVQAQILDLLRDLVRDHMTALVLVTHDLGVAAGLCQELMVMYRGKIVEAKDAEGLFASPRHPYTRALLAAVPRIDHRGRLHEIRGTTSPEDHWLGGCAFEPRCGSRQSDCTTPQEILRAQQPPGGVRCLHPAPGPALAEGQSS